MKLDHLTLFAQLQYYPSLNKACDKLYISHQALSKIIKNLETEFDTQLIQRNTKGISFTTSGELLCKTAVEISDLLNNTKKALTASYIKNNSQKLTIYTDSFTNENLLAQFLPFIYVEYPTLTIHIEKMDSLQESSISHTDKYLSDLNQLSSQENALCIFSFFNKDSSHTKLDTALTSDLILTNEIKLLGTSPAPLDADQVNTLIVNERIYGKENAFINYMRQYFSSLYLVQSQNQCIKALQKNSYTIDIANNIKVPLPGIYMQPFKPAIYFNTYTFTSPQSSETARLFAQLLREFFLNSLTSNGGTIHEYQTT